MEWWRKRLSLFILALFLWGNASGIGVLNQKTTRQWQVGTVTAPQDQAGNFSQQGNLVPASGAQTPEYVSNTASPSSRNPVYSSTGFLQTGNNSQRSLFLRWPSVSSSSDVPSSLVQVGTSWPGSSQYVAVSQQAPSSQSQYMPVSQRQTVYEQLPQVSLNLSQSVAQDQGDLGAQVQGSRSATASRWGSALESSQGTSQNVSLTQMTHKPVTAAQSSASTVVSMGQGSLGSQSTGFSWPTTSGNVGVQSQDVASSNAAVTLTQTMYKPLFPAQASSVSAVVSSGQAQSPSSSGWPASSGSVSSQLFSQPQGTSSQTGPGTLTRRTYNPVIPSQASSQSTVVSLNQSGYGVPTTGSVSWPTSTGSRSSQLLSQNTSQSSGGNLSQKPLKPGFPSRASSDSTILSGSLGRYGVQSAVSSWPTSSGRVRPQLVSRVTSPYDSVLGAKMNVPSSPAQVSGASTVVSRNQSSSAWSAFSSLSSQLPSQTQGTSSQTVYKPVVPSQGSSLSTVVSQDQVSYGAQPTGSNWSTSSGQLSVQLPSQGQAVGSQTQTSSDSMVSQGSSGTQSPGHATWYWVPSGVVFGQSNTPMPQYGRVTSSNVPSASEAYSSLLSTLTTSSSSSVPVSQPLVPHSGSAVTQYGDALVSQGTGYAASQGPSVSKFQVLKPSSPVSVDVSVNQLTSVSSSLFSKPQSSRLTGYDSAPTKTHPSFLRPAPWRSSDPQVLMGKQ